MDREVEIEKLRCEAEHGCRLQCRLGLARDGKTPGCDENAKRPDIVSYLHIVLKFNETDSDVFFVGFFFFFIV